MFLLRQKKAGKSVTKCLFDLHSPNAQNQKKCAHALLTICILSLTPSYRTKQRGLLKQQNIQLSSSTLLSMASNEAEIIHAMNIFSILQEKLNES